MPNPDRCECCRAVLDDANPWPRCVICHDGGGGSSCAGAHGNDLQRECMPGGALESMPALTRMAISAVDDAWLCGLCEVRTLDHRPGWFYAYVSRCPRRWEVFIARRHSVGGEVDRQQLVNVVMLPWHGKPNTDANRLELQAELREALCAADPSVADVEVTVARDDGNRDGVSVSIKVVQAATIQAVTIETAIEDVRPGVVFDSGVAIPADMMARARARA